MVTPQPSAALQGFIDDEILRAPLLVEQVVDAALDHLRKGMAGMALHERTGAHDLMQAVGGCRSRVVDAYVGSLRRQIGGDKPQARAAATRAPPLSLSLVDEGEVAVDVEISHTIEAIRSTCEYELRELQTFVAALVGDMDVSRDHNPLRAETHARALWASLQVLPLSRGYRLNFMRHAATPLAQVLRKAYAAASSRLEAMGIEPAAHRTVILPAGSRSPRRPDSSFNPDLRRIRESMPSPLADSAAAPAAGASVPLEQALAQAETLLRNLPDDAGPATRGQLLERQRAQLVESATTKVDQQLIELFSRLFDAMLSDRQLLPDIQLLLSRLQPSALRVALRDPKTLDEREHPLWRFIDLVAFQGEILPDPGDPQRERALRFVQGLISHVAAEPRQDGALYEWAIERLHSHARQRLQQRADAAEVQITALQAREEKLRSMPAATSTISGTLDVAQMDTVPAALIDTRASVARPTNGAEAWLARRRAGDWLRVFLQGRWVHAQIVWPGEHGELWLLGDAASPDTWAVRRRALLTLRSENLLDELAPRSLLVDAAKRVMRRALRP